METQVKQCKSCLKFLPKNTDYFYLVKHKYLDAKCKKCDNIRNKLRRDSDSSVLIKHRKNCREYYLKNKALINEKSKIRYSNNKLRYKHYRIKMVKNLSDGYIAGMFNKKLEDLNPEIIEIKRLIIQLKREISNK